MPAAGLLQSIQPFAIAIAFVVLYVLEHVYPARRDLMDNRHDLRNIGFGIFNFIVVFAAAYYFQVLIQYANNKGWGLLYLVHASGWIRYGIEFLLMDLFMYGWHRLNHRLPLLWRFHKFHHTDTKLNSTSALRFHTVELLLSYAARLLLFPLAGISVTGILLYTIVFSAEVIFHHSNIRISLSVDLLLRRIIVTPQMHRIHHSVIRRETDSNFSSVFSWWDMLFRSYTKLPEKEIEFGI